MEFEIDEATGIKKKKGWKVIKGSELEELGYETIAQKIADAEGKDANNATIRADILKRISKPVVIEPIKEAKIE